MKRADRKRGAFFVARVAAVCLAAAATEASFGDITQDDAHISSRYAENLVAGNGLVYNVGERVEGYTNFLWTFSIAASIKAGVGAPLAGRWLGVAAFREGAEKYEDKRDNFLFGIEQLEWVKKKFIK